ncbi:hypothetical protein DL93DRAFT_2103128 [Clavulina sp. PMI_390]|nr:hypothetical protein DL93DRAFT_2103128 [Clavulina sp. PMI_390]
MIFSKLAPVVVLATVVLAAPTDLIEAPRKVGKRCTGTISSYAPTQDAFAMDKGVTLEIDAPDGASITMNGDISFPYYEWDGPLMIVKGNSITFNGNGHSLKGNGDQYWDGEGTSGGKTKPAPLLRINHSGTFTNTIVKNAPARSVAIGGANVVVSSVTVDNSDGDSLGKNTDGFDVSSDGPVTIQNSKVHGQDDCLAINRGNKITFTGNTCTGPTHGISIGSIKSDTTVSNVVISNNVVTGAVNGLRIKTVSDATNGLVNTVTYSNTSLRNSRCSPACEEQNERSDPVGHCPQLVPVYVNDRPRISVSIANALAEACPGTEAVEFSNIVLS